MAEYIKREEVFKAYKDWLSTYDIGFDCAHDLWIKLDELPAETVVERRKGKWLEHDTDKTFAKCSECGCYWELAIVKECNMDFCPNCGADMRGET